ncbi:F-box protein At5g03100-like isoform X3 [Quercus robur]|uniref:F-box protein At5g03100-like isoform X3 n=1 Tax=Quercus robur TaxID=38942 RepID=UPI00216166C0|nr:F-box protein At5g03100-like isoform X3 [Quercus robur]
MEEQSSGFIHSFSDGYYPTNNSEEEEEEDEDHQTKRRKHAPILEEGEDRISTLPDSILLSILSFLPTQEAIKTGVLSKRWAYLWTSVPSLSFELKDCHSDGYYDKRFDDFTSAVDPMDDFISAVDHTLLLHTAPKLTNFSVRFKYRTSLKARLDLWVRFATTAKVNQLSLHLFLRHITDIGLGGYQLPQHLYANEFVSKFNFSYCKIFPNGLLHWSSLKHLCIGQSALCDDVIREVLMGSPRLESLELHDCWEFNRLDIVSESLRKLVIDSYVIYMLEGNVRELELEIVAPKIHSLEILGNFEKIKCRIKDVSALVEAKLDFDMRKSSECYFDDDYYSETYKEYYEEEEDYKEYQDIVRDILDSVHHVKKLTVGNWCLMIVSIMSVQDLPSPLSKCQCLTIVTSMEKWSLPGIGILLQSSPYVETLNFDFPSSRPPLKFLVSRYDEVNHWKSKEIYFKFLLRCLKSIKIKLFYFEGIHTKEFIFLVQFLLTNANVLEKMVITNALPMRISTSNMPLKSLQVALKLLNFPRSSPHAVVMFPYQ